ncbi:MAG: hypothetical protein GY909_12990 [Oligoflexia bacterium]|nr:hypothetical protein [Oligoflexia bacterium]
MKIVFFILSVYFLNTLTYGNFNKSEIIVRTSDNDGFNLPSSTDLSNITPVIDDRGNITFIGKWVGAEAKHGVWLGNSQGGTFQFYVSDSQFLTTPILFNNESYVGLNNETQFLGVFKVGKSNVQIIDPKDIKEVVGMNSLCFSKEHLFLRAKTWDDQMILKYDPISKTINTIEKTGESLSYIFNLSCFDKGVAFKGREGVPGNFDDDQPDLIFKIEKSKQVVVQDIDSSDNSRHKRFQNSIGTSSTGIIVFTSTLLNGKKAIFKIVDGKEEKIIEEGDFNLKQIEYFRPQVNNNGLVAFRGIDIGGKRNIFAIQDGVLKSLVREGDLMKTDRENAIVLDRKGWPGISGGFTLNNNNEVVYHVLLTTKDGSEAIGRAVYKNKY